MQSKFSLMRFSILILFLVTGLSQAGQTGKIAGRVIDAETSEPLYGVNLMVEETSLGAATDLEGDYLIFNIPPGVYSLQVSMLGYQKVTMTSIRVSVDRTTRLDFKLNSTTLNLGNEIMVEAKKELIQKDLTSSSLSVSAQEIQGMPVESFTDILQLQAGVTVDSRGEFHIRGGRSTEIAYLVDGVSVTDPYSGRMAVNINQDAIEELKVISGTFNAEYGQVMSGIVEVVTKDPETKTKAGFSGHLGDYVSSHDRLFYHIDHLSPLDMTNIQSYLTGPLPGLKKILSYYISLRYYQTDGWQYGQRRFNPTDSSVFDPTSVTIHQSGDNQPVAMNPSSQFFVNTKLVWKITPSIKISYNLMANQLESRGYNHLYKYNPDGDLEKHEYGMTHILSLNHTLSPQTFYTFKYSNYRYDTKSYRYEDLDDARYANPQLFQNLEDAYSFYTGGTNMDHTYRNTQVNLIKFEITSQMTKIHQFKSGLEFKHNRLQTENLKAYYNGLENGGYFDSGFLFNRGRFVFRPVEASAFLQDKIELNNMTVNIGLRYDYFDSRGKVPIDLRDPGDVYPGDEAPYRDAETHHQISPRLGLAFPISASGVVHGSYGHFFQIPTYEYVFYNPRFGVAPGGLSTLMGNAELKPQSTVIYEIGFQQELFGSIGLEVTGFYKDARNLLGTQIYETYVLGDRYARYVNRDYGNIRGITLSFDKYPKSNEFLTISLDYSYQIAEGNASDPNHEFYNQTSDPPKSSNIQVIPLDWDQRHTVNLSVIYDNPRWFHLGVIGQFQTGLPYTPARQNLETSFENSGRKPFVTTIDLQISRRFNLKKQTLTGYIKVYNLFDRKNELTVYNDTGRSGYSLVSQYIGERRNWVNTLDDWLLRPDYYSEPRKILVGFDLEISL
ncbi:MAG: TonB-dependent receptor [Candidatus Delongbacteria bacterium]|nr:TonB-dependent receptor [Candidatus Delongbacteria bacterium]